MQERPVVGLDFDDVLFDFNGALLVYHNEMYGTSYRLQDVTSFELKELWQCDASEAIRRMNEFVESSHHAEGLPILGAVNAVHTLAKKYNLHIVTARDKRAITRTLEVVTKHFPTDAFSGIHFLHDHGENVLGNKGEVCQRLGVKIMIEDSLGNANHLSSAGIRTLLFDTTWNQSNTLPKHVTRVFGWDHTLQEIESFFG